MAAKWVSGGRALHQKAEEVQASPWDMSLGSTQASTLHLAIGTKWNAFCFRTEEFRNFKMCIPEENFSYTTISWEYVILSLDTLLLPSVKPFPPSCGNHRDPDRGRLSVLYLHPWSLGLCLEHMKAFEHGKDGFLADARESVMFSCCWVQLRSSMKAWPWNKVGMGNKPTATCICWDCLNLRKSSFPLWFIIPYHSFLYYFHC